MLYINKPLSLQNENENHSEFLIVEKKNFFSAKSNVSTFICIFIYIQHIYEVKQAKMIYYNKSF